MPVPPPAACPLCAGTRAHRRERLTVAELEHLWFQADVRLSDAAKDSFGDHRAIALEECRDCGCRYFSPAPIANAAFRADVARQRGPAEADAAAQSAALELAQKHGLRTVLDVGCGAGALLTRAREAGLAATGIEADARAAAQAHALGHAVEIGTLEDSIPEAGAPLVALLTAFGSLAATARPTAFLRAATARVAPGGWIFLSVPNGEGAPDLSPLDPARWPPAECQRWRAADLTRLAASVGLAVDEIRITAFDADDARDRLAQQSARETLLARPPVRGAFSAWLHRQGWLPRHGRTGPMLHAILRLP